MNCGGYFMFPFPWDFDIHNGSGTKYTMQLNEVIAKLHEDGKTIWDGFTYTLPSFMSTSDLQARFESHYYFREIGVETIERWLQRFHTLWLERLNEYSIKFEMAHDLDKDNAMNTYGEVVNDKTTFQATPMSSLNPNKSYATSINTLEGSRQGHTSKDNAFKRTSDIINNHTEVVEQFISEFDKLFMQIF